MIGQTVLEHFTVDARLGEGGMGEVYRAHDPRGMPVAIKRLHAEVSRSPEVVARFEREAAAQGTLSHPNIAGLYAVGVSEDGAMVFAMEYVDGHDLATELERVDVLEPQRAFGVISQLLSALHHAHQFGFIHRDLKPENVLLARVGNTEQVKVIDFGLVKMLDDVLGAQEVQRLTQTGVIFGTPEYMAPEQIQGLAVDTRTDLYAVGILIYELLSGRRPYEYEEISDLWRAHLYSPIPSLSEHAQHLPPALLSDLDGVLAGLLAKQPEERFASAHAVRRALSSAFGA
ncbi:serine/threonine protein kinase [Plesiocystis pacifica SIR-1]|uniref:Serine/threonine protein kinase n=1 Tax=Plesiocystis pacifica SIR-1 TaxID=391625 RepID=A6G8V2_9BACT|nr:serine/threonine-protein kinase [Plesiocystis pacifica]EDM77638.1 serine/threonine protein kinase [Plesiocystis pacifica SIR-1]